MLQQLDIFSRETELSEKAWQALSQREWTLAKNLIEELQNTTAQTSTMEFLHQYLDDFKDCFEKNTADVSALYSVLNTYPFISDWGALLCKSAYLHYVAELSEQQSVFFLRDGESLADLYVVLNQPARACQLMAKALETSENNQTLLWHAGNIYWKAGQFSESRFYYLKALLLFPGQLPGKSCADPLLQKIILQHALVEVPAVSWLYGEVLPLRRLHELQVPESNSFKLCQYLLKVENHSGTDQVFWRKQLHALNADFFSLYFHWKKTGKISR